MGSRAVVVVCRDEEAARRRFGVAGGRARHLLHPHRAPLLRRRGAGAGVPATGARGARPRPASGSELETDWVLLDCELMPWSAKAQELLQRAVRGRGRRRRGPRWPTPRPAIHQAPRRGLRVDRALAAGGIAGRRSGTQPLRRRLPSLLLAGRLDRRLALAPFQLLASEGAVHLDRDHRWQMETLAELSRADAEASDRPLLASDSTPSRRSG